MIGVAIGVLAYVIVLSDVRAMAPDDDDARLDGQGLLDDALDADDAAELERWFGLPSFQQVAEDQARRSRRARRPECRGSAARSAMAAVDPALLERIHARTEVQPDGAVAFKPTSTFTSIVDRAVRPSDGRARARIAEPREVEIPDELKDDLKECTPQALLRDLHRPELVFEKAFEVIDMAAEQRLDIVAEVEPAMSDDLKLPPLGIAVVEDELPLARRRSRAHGVERRATAKSHEARKDARAGNRRSVEGTQGAG